MSALLENEHFRVVMTGDNEVTVCVMIDYPISARRWTRLFRGSPDDPKLRALLADMGAVREALAGASLPVAREVDDKWYDGMWSYGHGS